MILDLYVSLIGTAKENLKGTKAKLSSYTVQYPILKIAKGALHLISWQICSTEHHTDFSGKLPATLLKDYLHTNIHHCL